MLAVADQPLHAVLHDVLGVLLTGAARAQEDAQRLAVGEVQDLHHVMIRLEEAKASFQLFLQVRNRLLDAYQEVMRMQI